MPSSADAIIAWGVIVKEDKLSPDERAARYMKDHEEAVKFGCALEVQDFDYENPPPIAVISRSITSTVVGEPRQLTRHEFEGPKGKWGESLRGFLEAIGLEADESPGWKLFARG